VEHFEQKPVTNISLSSVDMDGKHWLMGRPAKNRKTPSTGASTLAMSLQRAHSIWTITIPGFSGIGSIPFTIFPFPSNHITSEGTDQGHTFLVILISSAKTVCFEEPLIISTGDPSFVQKYLMARSLNHPEN